MSKTHWQALLLMAAQSHISETQPQLPLPTSLDEAITAMVDPEGYRQGAVDKARIKIKFH